MRTIRWFGVAVGVLALVGAVAVGGCESSGGGSDASGGSGSDATGGGGGAQPAANCADRCATKAASCGAPASIAGQMCATICAENPTEDQARCMETSSCQALEGAMMGGGLPCGIGQGGGDGGDGGGGEACDGEAPYCDGDELVSCIEVAGQPAEQRFTCAAGCRNARCLHYYELCDPGFESSGCDRDECDMSDVLVVDGVRYCTSSCGPDDECPSGTDCFHLNSTQSICLPACEPGASGGCPDGFLERPCGDEGACGL